MGADRNVCYAATADGRKLNGYTRSGLIPVLEVFDLPAPYQPFNPVFQGQLSGEDFTNLSTRQEPTAGICGWPLQGVEHSI